MQIRGYFPLCLHEAWSWLQGRLQVGGPVTTLVVQVGVSEHAWLLLCRPARGLAFSSLTMRSDDALSGHPHIHIGLQIS